LKEKELNLSVPASTFSVNQHVPCGPKLKNTRQSECGMRPIPGQIKMEVRPATADFSVIFPCVAVFAAQTLEAESNVMAIKNAASNFFMNPLPVKSFRWFGEQY